MKEKIKHLRKKIKLVVEKRLDDFSRLGMRSNRYWFSEMCFCILTANSKALTAIAIQKELGPDGFINCAQSGLVRCIKDNKHRFHNNKANYIVAAREHIKIKSEVLTLVEQHGQRGARDWIAENIKGLGYKESSHFLRNVGYTDVAILDRHILNLMVENGYLKEKPKTLTKKRYHEIEEIFASIAKGLKMNLAELDLYMWYMKTGEVLK